MISCLPNSRRATMDPEPVDTGIVGMAMIGEDVEGDGVEEGIGSGFEALQGRHIRSSGVVAELSEEDGVLEGDGVGELQRRQEGPSFVVGGIETKDVEVPWSRGAVGIVDGVAEGGVDMFEGEGCRCDGRGQADDEAAAGSGEGKA